jgi:penicillin amidase
MTNITPKDMMRLQAENYNVFAEFARPVLMKYMDSVSLNADEQKYLDIVKHWNLRNDPDQTGISVFKAWWDSLEVVIFGDEIYALTNNGNNKAAAKWPDESTLVEGLLKDSVGFRFTDDITTTEIETLETMVSRAFKMAVDDLKKVDSDGNLPWGKYKATAVRHLLKIPALSRMNLDIGGGEHIINATKQFHGPSWRMIVHMTDQIEAYGVYPGGQHGNPGSKYYDTFIDNWVKGEYYPLLFIKKEEVVANTRIRWHLKFLKA